MGIRLRIRPWAGSQPWRRLFVSQAARVDDANLVGHSLGDMSKHSVPVSVEITGPDAAAKFGVQLGEVAVTAKQCAQPIGFRRIIAGRLIAVALDYP